MDIYYFITKNNIKGVYIMRLKVLFGVNWNVQADCTENNNQIKIFLDNTPNSYEMIREVDPILYGYYIKAHNESEFLDETDLCKLVLPYEYKKYINSIAEFINEKYFPLKPFQKKLGYVKPTIGFSLVWVYEKEDYLEVKYNDKDTDIFNNYSLLNKLYDKREDGCMSSMVE